MREDFWANKLDNIHPYPAKYPLKLANEYILRYTTPGDLVYDPFMGSGTTLLSSSINGRRSKGIDINAIAVLISNIKIKDFDSESIKKLQTFSLRFINGELREPTQNVTYKNIDHWFSSESIRGLSFIKEQIDAQFKDDEKLNLFCRVVFSSILNQVSKQESNTRYAAIEKEWITEEYVLQTYYKKFNSALQIFSNISRDPKILSESGAYLHDSKRATEIIPEESVDFILTSPPYPNTYDYYLYNKHRMLWLDYDFESSKYGEIGSRNEFSSKKQPSSNFDKDLMCIFLECDKVLKTKAKIVIVIGDGVIQGEMYDSRAHTEDVCSSIGWNLVSTTHTQLDKTSRSFNKHFRSNGKKEHIMVFEK